LRIVHELKPRTFVMENVPGMATGAHTQLLTELIQEFTRSGYNLQLPFRILNAADYGVPQNRRRLFLVGSLAGAAPEYPNASTRRYSAGDSPTLAIDDLPQCPTVADALDDLPDIDCFEELLETDELRYELEDGSAYAMILRGEVLESTDLSYPRLFPYGVLTGCQRARHTPLSRRRFAQTQPGTTEPVSRFYRLTSNGICNTLRAGTATDRGAFTAPRPIHHLYPRCISVREAARLHSYPDWFRFHRTIWHGFRQIGNSVPPLLARAVANEILRSLGVRVPRPTTALPVSQNGLLSFNMKEAAEYFNVQPDVIARRLRTSASVGQVDG
jgi:DNA (cytosine-5)-methyltransferase 1